MLGIFCGIKYMLWGSVVTSLIAYFLNSYYSAVLICYPTKEQIKDVLPSFIISALIAAIMWEFLLGYIRISPINDSNISRNIISLIYLSKNTA